MEQGNGETEKLDSDLTPSRLFFSPGAALAVDSLGPNALTAN
jgi:hypothetical protein